METTEQLQPQKKKHSKKLMIGGGVLLLGLVGVLSACTASFCSEADLSHIMKAYEPGVMTYHATNDVVTIDGIEVTPTKLEGTNVYYTTRKNGTIASIDKQAIDAGYYIPTLEYWVNIDILTLEKSLVNFKDWYANASEEDKKDVDYFTEKSDIDKKRADYLIENFGHVKFLGNNLEGEETRWVNFDEWTSTLSTTLPQGSCPNNSYLGAYKNSIDTYTNANRSCIALKDGKYGSYIPVGEEIPEGTDAGKAFVTAKSWGYAWKKGFFEGLIVYPVGALVELFSNAFGGGGWGQVGAIILVTIIVRLFLQAITLWATKSQIKMQALQPEIQKIQAKYPDSKENRQEQQRMAQEQQQLYKKHKVRMWMPILQMALQIPIFISVWGAMTGSASLASDSLFGLHLSSEMSGILFSSAVGTGGWWTALILFLIMTITQVGSMILPNILTKLRAKKITNKLGPAPKQKGMGGMMSVIMGVMIIVMGLFLPAAMTIYWIMGAVVSTITTVITHFLTIRVMENLGKKKPLKTAKRARVKK